MQSNLQALNATGEDIKLAQTIVDTLRMQEKVDKKNKKEKSVAKPWLGYLKTKRNETAVGMAEFPNTTCNTRNGYSPQKEHCKVCLEI